MFTDTHAKFEVKSLASIFVMKFLGLVADSTTNARKTGQLITIGNCQRISEALAITCENKSAVFRDWQCKSIFFHTTLLCLHELWDILFESKGEEQESGLLNSV